MPISTRQKQKKLEQKNRKKAEAKKALRQLVQSKGQALFYAQYPVHECLVPDGLFRTGLASLFVARRTPDGQIAVSAFVLDVYCLGVKNAFFHVFSEHGYEHELKAPMIAQHEGQQFEKLHVACMKKLIEGGVEYARALGFSPHPDYRKAKALLGDMDAGACPVHYEYGRDGKPFYIRGPNESLARARQIVAQLDRKCSEGNFDYIMPLDEGPLPGDD